jgi:hypothetical protein
MVETFNNLISLQQLDWFRKDFDRLINIDFVERLYNPVDAKQIYGIDNCSVQDRRHRLSPGDSGYKLMKSILAPIIPASIYFYMAYQRQFLPHQLHVDDVGPNTNLDYAKSAIIPLYDDPDNIFKTIIWNQVCLNTDQMQTFFRAFIDTPTQFPVLADISGTEDVDHCWGKPSIVDVMPLDGIYKYELGSMGLFDRTHIHCSSNWRKYNIYDHKDIILLHIG